MSPNKVNKQVYTALAPSKAEPLNRKGEDASPDVDEGSSGGATSPSPSEEEPVESIGEEVDSIHIKPRDDHELFGNLSPDEEEENVSAVAAKSRGNFNITLGFSSTSDGGDTDDMIERSIEGITLQEKQADEL